MDDINQYMVKRCNYVMGLLFAFRDLRMSYYFLQCLSFLQVHFACYRPIKTILQTASDMFEDINATMRLVRSQSLPFTTTKEP